ncbi:DNA primase-polymerase [Paracoccus phage vB_PmaP_KLEP18-1]|nr:DNA primase-polymerase [Paracoccus phage vB_PmaP_KLEP18-1]
MAKRKLSGRDLLETDARQAVVVWSEDVALAVRAATGRLCVAWAGDPARVDFSPLSGRAVVVWPAPDDTGEDVAARLHDLGCSVKLMAVNADGYADGWGRDEIDGFMRRTAAPWVPHEPELEPDPVPIPPNLDSMPAWMDEAPPPSEEDFLAYADEAFDRPVNAVEVSRHARLEVPREGRVMGGVFTPWGGDMEAMREWAFLTAEGLYQNVHTGERMGKSSFDLVKTVDCPVIETVDGKGETVNKRFPPSRTLAEYLDGLVVSNSMYRPDVGGLLFEKDGVRYLNDYRPAYIPAADPEWRDKDAWQVVNDHFHNVIPAGADLVLDWWAHNVQRPGVKILWSPVIIGVPGDGKTTLAKVGQMAMGVTNVQVASPEAVNSDFTDWAYGAAVRVLEEIRVSGQSRAHVMDKLKPFITNEIVDVVGKGQKSRNIINVTNYFALSNHIDALAIDENDRRWGVWKTRFTSAQHMRADTGKEYWRKLHDAINNHAGVIRGWLMARDLSKFDRFDPPPLNDAKLAMVEASRSPMVSDIMEAIELGGEGIGENVLVTDLLNQQAQNVGGRKISTSSLSSSLVSLGWTRWPATLKWRDRSRRVYYRASAFAGVDDLPTAFRRALDDTEIASDSPSAW